MPLLSRNPDKLEQKAVDYERKGKPQKAVKCRDKAARLRAHHASHGGAAVQASNPLAPLPAALRPANAAPIGGVGAPIIPATTAHASAGHNIVQRTPAQYENNALKWEQRGNWAKAQKNREKVWRLRNPQHAQATAPQFYNNNRFVGYDVPLTGIPVQQHHSHGAVQPPLGYPSGGVAHPPLLGQQGHGILNRNRDPIALEAKAAEYERRGKPAKAQKYREKAARVKAGTYTSQRNPQFYENQALKWEKRGNWDKAQKNRSKYWRHQNPQYAQHQAPSFYNNGAFLGYNVPIASHSTTITSHNQGIPSTLAPAGPHTALLASRDPVRLEARAAEYDRKGKTAKAQKLRAKAAKIRGGNFQSARTPQIWEAKALQYEQAGNWKKAQKNREKAWRHQNPTYHYSTHPAPQFYDNNRFLGYNIPYQHSGIQQTGIPLTTGIHQTGIPITTGFQQTGVHQTGIPLNTGIQQITTGIQQTGFQQSGIPITTGIHQAGVPVGQTVSYGQGIPSAGNHLLPSRDPARLEARAAEYDRKGKTAKAQKLREKAARIRAGSFQSRRNPQIWEAKAIQYEQAGNFKKAQKIREKIWRTQNPTYFYTTHPAPQFYESNRFLGYNIPFQQGFQQTSSFSQTSTQTIYAAPIIEQVTRPVIVEQTSRPERIVEVQPIIHREVDAPTVKIIEQHVYETVPSVGPNTITKTAIVQETVIPRIIEEVQPIVHREVPAPFVERVEQHVTEHIVKPTIETREVINTGSTIVTQGIAAGAPISAQTSFSSSTFVSGQQYAFISRDPVRLEARAVEYERKGKAAKAQKLRQKAALIRAGTFQSRRNPQIWEANALKWEQAGNWKKAQKNREKVWRHNNPSYHYSTHPAPQFYNSNRFLGYNIPIQQTTSIQQTGLPIAAGIH